MEKSTSSGSGSKRGVEHEKDEPHKRLKPEVFISKNFHFKKFSFQKIFISSPMTL
jgi:hypothetical protein